MRRYPLIKRGISLAIAATLAFTTVTTSAQRRGRADNTSQGAPVATNTIADTPDVYFGKVVTISAGVNEMLSKTTFLMDQRKMVNAKEVQPVGKPILVIAPYLTTALSSNSYMLVRGEVVKFDPAMLARVAPGYSLDLSPELGTKFTGQPVLVAASVINSTFKELGKKPIPAPKPEDLSLSSAMKSINPAFTALKNAADMSKVDGVASSAATLRKGFSDTEAIWGGLSQKEAMQLAIDARTHVAAIETAATAGNWDSVKTSANALNQVCANCHATYRERQDDGTFRFKTAPAK